MADAIRGGSFGSGGVLTTNTWAGIKAIVEAGKTDDYFKIGDEIPLTLLTGEQLIMQVGAIGLYQPHRLSLVSKHVLNELRFLSGSWGTGSLRIWLNDTFLNTHLPEEVRKVITPKTLTRRVMNTGGSGGSASFRISTDSIWILSSAELFHSGGYGETDSKQFSIFVNNTSRIKIRGTTGLTNMYWTSTDSGADANYVWRGIVGNDGALYGSREHINNEGYNIGVVPCFDI